MQQHLSKYLKRKIVYPTSVVTIISAIIILISSTYVSLRNVQSNLTTTGEIMHDEIKYFLSTYAEMEKGWETNQSCIDFLQSDRTDEKLNQNIIATMKNIVKNNDNILNVYINHDKTNALITQDADLYQDFDFDETYFEISTQFDENFYITEPYTDVLTNDTVITMFYLITYEKQRIGVIAYDIVINSIPELVQSHELNLDGKAMLIADGGIVLSSPNDEENNTMITDLDISSRAIAALDENVEGVMICKYNGERYRMQYKAIDGTKWRVVILTPLKDIILHIAMEGFFVLIVLCALNLLMNRFLRKESKSIANKIESLAQSSIEISNENYDLQLVVDDETEIGSLQDAMTKILTRLKEYKVYIEELSGLINHMSSCDYTHTTTLNYVGEFAIIKQALYNLREETVQLLTQLGQISSSIVDGSKEISTVSNYLAEGAESQTSYVNDFSMELNALIDMLEGTISMLHVVESKSTSANNQLAEGTDIMQQLVDTMSQTKTAANEITNILQTQKEISNRINLLSLNASIEAARAGESGRGFAVVAQEIGKLAEESARATEETGTLIENTIQAVNNGQTMVSETSESFTSLSTDISDMVQAFSNSINNLVGQIDKFDTLKEGISKISDIANDTLAVSQQTAASAETFTQNAEQLKTLIEKYKI